MGEPDFGPLRAKLIEAQEELRQSERLAEQVDLHAAAAKRKIGEASAEFDKLATKIAQMKGNSANGGQQR